MSTSISTPSASKLSILELTVAASFLLVESWSLKAFLDLPPNDYHLGAAAEFLTYQVFASQALDDSQVMYHLSCMIEKRKILYANDCGLSDIQGMTGFHQDLMTMQLLLLKLHSSPRAR